MLRSDGSIPAFRDGLSIVRAAAKSLRSPLKMSVSAAAEKHRMLATPGGYRGPWKNAARPFLAEPMDRMLSRSVALWVMLGPTQFGKSEIFLNFIGHAIKYRPGDILILQPSKSAAQDFAERRIEQRLIRCSPDYKAELGRNRGDDKVFSKTFLNGMRIDAIWPTPTELAGRPAKTVLIDERDRIPDDIGGEGDPVDLGRNRITDFGKEGLVAAASTPAGDETSAIVSLFYQGDQSLWFWPCPDCGEYWSPGFDLDRKPTLDHLYVAPGLTPGEAGELACLICPHCGVTIAEHAKGAMNAAGRWVPLGCSITPGGEIVGRRPSGRTASYWLSGLVSPNRTWGALVEELVSAEMHFDRTGEESQLKAVYNTKFGIPYRSRGDAAPVDADALERRREAYLLGQVPPGVRFLTAAVDIGGRKFDVSVKGWGEEGESWLVDRFVIRQLADGKTDLSPGTHIEHWDELFGRVFEARYPVIGRPGHYLPVAGVVMDTQGVPGVWENAKSFWLKARKRGIPDWSITMIKGASDPKAPIIRAPSFERDRAGRELVDASSFRWYMIGVSMIKDIVSARLRRDVPGPGFLHFPQDLGSNFLAELSNEEKQGKEWVRTGPNETFDLEVYNFIAAYRLKPGRVNWSSPPHWAAAVPIDTADETPAALAELDAAAAEPVETAPEVGAISVPIVARPRLSRRPRVPKPRPWQV